MRESRLICGIDQVCVVVRDLDGALETMTAKAGIGPFKTWTLQSPWVWHTTYRGRRVRWSMRLGLAYVGGIQWEVIQPANGPTLYGDYIGRYGDGLHHLLISPRGSRHHALARLAAHGAAHAQSAVVLKAAQVGPVPLAIPSALAPLAGARFGYADTFDDLGAYLELVSYPFGLPGLARHPARQAGPVGALPVAALARRWRAPCSRTSCPPASSCPAHVRPPQHGAGWPPPGRGASSPAASG